MLSNAHTSPLIDVGSSEIVSSEQVAQFAEALKHHQALFVRLALEDQVSPIISRNLRSMSFEAVDGPAQQALAVGGFAFWKVELSGGSGCATIVLPPLVVAL